MEPQEDSAEAQKLDTTAVRHRMNGEYEEAETLYQRAKTLRESEFGPEHPSAAKSLVNLASLRRELGRPTEEQALYEQALYIQEKAYPEGHPDMTEGLRRLANLYRKSGRLAEAERMALRARDIIEASLERFGPSHHNTVAVDRALAAIYDAQGRTAEAAAILAVSQRTVGNMMAPVFAVAAEQMAAMSRKVMTAPAEDIEALAQVEPAMLQSIRGTEKLVGPDHPAVADLLDHYAVLLRKLGRASEADAQAARAAAIRTKASASSDRPGDIERGGEQTS